MLPREFGITPLRGYRSWLVGPDGRLQSAWNNQVWPLRAPAEATCNICNDSPCLDKSYPYHPCGSGCGFYVWHSMDSAQPKIRVWETKRIVWGVAEAWGTTVYHELGLRARFMRPVAILSTYQTDARPVAAAYEIEFIPSIWDLRKRYPPLING